MRITSPRALLIAGCIFFSNLSLSDAGRSALPIPPPAFDGSIHTTVDRSKPSSLPVVPPTPPQGAPNILLFMSDDAGFGMASTFGGLVPTPTFDKLAQAGVRYNRFHTTAICSTTRAALLTGRNHHNAGVGFLSDFPNQFPGYNANFPPSVSTIAEILQLNGYSTAMFGKHHNVPPGQDSTDGPFDMWPTGLGFDYFYGFLGGETNQWAPNLYRGTSLLPDEETEKMLDARLADDLVTWVHNQKAVSPDKPFFIYLAPGSTHSPHQAPPEYIARFKGKFDQGWDKAREEIYRRQIDSGIIPEETVLTPRPDAIPSWASLSPKQKAFAARSMEVAAAMLAYQDEQLGRVIAELDRMGELENTLVIAIQGDNGASAESGINGTINEIGHMINGIEEDEDWLFSNIDKMGTRDTYGNYPVGWSWAMNTPFRWTKQYASMLGGIRNGMVMSWPGHVSRPNSVCSEFGHVVDIAPTLLEASGLPGPSKVYGVEQKPLDGKSLMASLGQCVSDRSKTQYFEIAGKIGLYDDGWLLTSDNGRKPWESFPETSFDPEHPEWEL